MKTSDQFGMVLHFFLNWYNDDFYKKFFVSPEKSPNWRYVCLAQSHRYIHTSSTFCRVVKNAVKVIESLCSLPWNWHVWFSVNWGNAVWSDLTKSSYPLLYQGVLCVLFYRVGRSYKWLLIKSSLGFLIAWEMNVACIWIMIMSK